MYIPHCSSTPIWKIESSREEKWKEIEQYPYSIEIQAITTSPRQINKFLCTEIEESICQNLSDIIGTFPSSENPYQIGYRCIIKRYNDRSEGCIVLENKMQTELDCCNCAPVHTVDVKSILSFWKVCMQFLVMFCKMPDAFVLAYCFIFFLIIFLSYGMYWIPILLESFVEYWRDFSSVIFYINQFETFPIFLEIIILMLHTSYL